MLSREQLDELAKQHPELTEFLKTNPFPAVPWENFPQARANSVAGAAGIRKVLEDNPPPGLSESTITVTLRDGYEATLLVIRPTAPAAAPNIPPSDGAPSGGRPLILLFHGGGYCIGNPVLSVGPARALSALFGAVAVSMPYRLAPEHQWPQQPHDGIDATRWCALNAGRPGSGLEDADPARCGFLVGGTSAGGNMTAQLVKTSLAEGWAPAFTGVFLNFAYLLAPSIVPDEYRERYVSRSQPGPRESPALSDEHIRIVESGALLNLDPNSPYFSPFHNVPAVADASGVQAATENGDKGKDPYRLGSWPKTFLQVAGGDPLRDDSLIMEDALKQQGVPTRTEIYPGLPHAFNGFFPQFKVSHQSRIDEMLGFGWLLGREVSEQQAQDIVAKYLPVVGWD